ncbi:hypothetical protein JEM67_24715 [Serratia sp. PAMC26656]|uniref:hypothetical protein n=1 Tax=Serratia sp. PAMC26656 TaxID=2775909 RepID=UPI0018F65D51|nr:hypothetical protein [Serratia sp. PAMC26656]MBJ7890474.1 hypothetical protein [Serratia sp. PAMC26656]
MFGLKVRLVMDIAETQRAGVKAAFIRWSGSYSVAAAKYGGFLGLKSKSPDQYPGDFILI